MPRFMEKLRESVTSSFYTRHVNMYRLQHTEDGMIIVYYVNKGSPRFERLEGADNC